MDREKGNTESNQRRDAAARIRAKQGKLLLELTEVVNTLTRLEEVLDAIRELAELTEEEEKERSNIASKQRKLLEELQKWKEASDTE